MRTRSLLHPLAVAVCMLALTGCGKSKYSTPTAAARTFATAIMKGDAAGMKDASINGDPAMMDMLAQMMASDNALASAAQSKFGDDSKQLTDEDRMSDKFDKFNKALDTADVKIDGDSATVTTKDDPTMPIELKKVSGEWKVDASKMPGMGAGGDFAAMSSSLKAMVDVNNQLATDISAGKYATVADAKKARGEKIMAAMMSK